MFQFWINHESEGSASPVILGSYHRTMICSFGLMMGDILQRYLYKYSIVKLINPLVEKFLIIVEKWDN